MKDESKDAFYITLLTISAIAGAYFGGGYGLSEEGYIGMVVGGLSDGFVAGFTMLLLSPLAIPAMFGLMFLGPVAVVIVVFYYLTKS